jgi:hypothetical protein
MEAEAAAGEGVAAVARAALERAAAAARDDTLAAALGALPLELRMVAAQRLQKLLAVGSGGAPAPDLRGALNPLALPAQLRESAVRAMSLLGGGGDAPTGSPARFKMPPALRHMDAWAVQPRVRMSTLRAVGWRAAAGEAEARTGFLGGSGGCEPAPPPLPTPTPASPPAPPPAPLPAPAPLVALLPSLLQPLMLALARRRGSEGACDTPAPAVGAGAAPLHVSVFDDGGLFLPLPPVAPFPGDEEALADEDGEEEEEDGKDGEGVAVEGGGAAAAQKAPSPPTAKRARGGEGEVRREVRHGGGGTRAHAAGSVESQPDDAWCTIV